MNHPQGKTSELVERLRTEAQAIAIGSSGVGGVKRPILLDQAASELTRLEEENGKLRAEAADILAMTGCRDRADLEDMARVGKSLLDAIACVTTSGPYKGWAPADDPAEIVTDLINDLGDAQSLNVEAVGVLEPFADVMVGREDWQDRSEIDLPVSRGVNYARARLLIREFRAARSLLSRLQSGSENKDLAGVPGGLASASGVFSPESEAGDSAPHHAKERG